MPTASQASEESAPLPEANPSDEVANGTEASEPVHVAQPEEFTSAKIGSEAGPALERLAPSSVATEKPQKLTQQIAGSEKRESLSQGHEVRDPQYGAARPHAGMAERTKETLHRASTVARGVIEDEVKRVEKIRHVSSVVIEEASYDPSLRFVLVALGLFIVFIILLVLSKVMG